MYAPVLVTVLDYINACPSLSRYRNFIKYDGELGVSIPLLLIPAGAALDAIILFFWSVFLHGFRFSVSLLFGLGCGSWYHTHFQSHFASSDWS